MAIPSLQTLLNSSWHWLNQISTNRSRYLIPLFNYCQFKLSRITNMLTDEFLVNFVPYMLNGVQIWASGGPMHYCFVISWKYLFTSFVLWHGALSCWKIQSGSPGIKSSIDGFNSFSRVSMYKCWSILTL